MTSKPRHEVSCKPALDSTQLETLGFIRSPNCSSWTETKQAMFQEPFGFSRSSRPRRPSKQKNRWIQSSSGSCFQRRSCQRGMCWRWWHLEQLLPWKGVQESEVREWWSGMHAIRDCTSRTSTSRHRLHRHSTLRPRRALVFGDIWLSHLCRIHRSVSHARLVPEAKRSVVLYRALTRPSVVLWSLLRSGSFLHSDGRGTPTRHGKNTLTAQKLYGYGYSGRYPVQATWQEKSGQARLCRFIRIWRSRPALTVQSRYLRVCSIVTTMSRTIVCMCSHVRYCR